MTTPPSSPHSHATNVVVRIPVPKATVSSSHEPLGPGQTSELKVPDKCYLWKIKKIHGGEELILLLRVRFLRVMPAVLPYSGIFSRVQNFAKLLVEPSEEIFVVFIFRACAL